MKHWLIAGVVLLAACGTTTVPEQDFEGAAEYTGIVQVLAQGTRSETVVLEENDTGQWYSLVGDMARELVRMAGMTITITALPSEEGRTIRSEFPRLQVVAYVEVSGVGGGSDREY